MRHMPISSEHSNASVYPRGLVLSNRAVVNVDLITTPPCICARGNEKIRVSSHAHIRKQNGYPLQTLTNTESQMSESVHLPLPTTTQQPRLHPGREPRPRAWRFVRRPFTSPRLLFHHGLLRESGEVRRPRIIITPRSQFFALFRIRPCRLANTLDLGTGLLLEAWSLVLRQRRLACASFFLFHTLCFVGFTPLDLLSLLLPIFAGFLLIELPSLLPDPLITSQRLWLRIRSSRYKAERFVNARPS